ncbi:hypothetical protein CLOSCI_01560 [[Clostridium] scindens ATCC 35704]|nr:hypothetical protein CLOSCI_01560 [[Clostridium] scindens ATCC 35704]
MDFKQKCVKIYKFLLYKANAYSSGRRRFFSAALITIPSQAPTSKH